MWDSYDKNIINTFNDLISLAEKTSTVSKGEENLSKYIELYLCYLYKCL